MYITHVEASCKRKATICARNDTSEYGINSHCNQGKNQGRWTLGKHHMFAISKNYSYQELRFVAALWSEFKETSSTCYSQCKSGIKYLMNCSLGSLYTGLIANSTIFFRHKQLWTAAGLRMQALHLLGILKEKQLQPNSITYCNTISACARCQDQMFGHCVLM